MNNTIRHDTKGIMNMNTKAKVSDGINRDKVVVEGKEYGILGRSYCWCETFKTFLRGQGKLAGGAKVDIVAERELADTGTAVAYMVEYAVNGMGRVAYVYSQIGFVDEYTENYIVASSRIPALEECARKHDYCVAYRRAVVGK